MSKRSGLPLVVVGIGVGWWMRGINPQQGRGAESQHTGPTIQQIQPLSSLVTQKVTVVDAQETHLRGYTGGTKAAALIRGDFLLAVDLSQGRFEEVDEKTRTAVLVLPRPEVQQPRVDHEHTRLVAISQSGLWQLTPGEGHASAKLINQAYADAQRYVNQAGGDPAMLAQARQRAEQVIAAFCEAVGWKITVRWAE